MRTLLRATAAVLVAGLLASCGSDVDVCTNPGGGCPPRDYSVDIAVTSSGRFGALQLDITHLGEEGGFVGTGDKVDCVALVDSITVSNYIGERTTKVGMISLEGIVTPASILRCGFRTQENLKPSDFEVEVTDASDVESNQVEPPPTVVVTSVVERESD